MGQHEIAMKLDIKANSNITDSGNDGNKIRMSTTIKNSETEMQEKPSKYRGATSPKNDPQDEEDDSDLEEDLSERRNGDSLKGDVPSSGPYVCPLCDQALNTPHAFTLHIRQHNPNDHSHTCRLCGKTLSSASSLDRHMLVHSGERPFKCKMCNMAFTTNGNMHRHMRTHGDETSEKVNAKGKSTSKRKLEGGTGPFAKKIGEEMHCPVCNKEFPCSFSLRSHMDSHPNDPIWCKECNVVMGNYSKYEDHRCIVANSNEVPPTSVGFQDLTFVDIASDKFSLVAKTICENDSRRPSSAFHAFECSKCEKAFPCSSALRLHSMSHSDKRGTFCPSCNCSFQTMAELQAHQLKHRVAEHCDIAADGIESGKEDFLALLDLHNREECIVKIRPKKERCREPHFENFSYFVHGKPELPIRGTESESSDFADIQSIISNTSKTPLVGSIRASSALVAAPTSPPQVTSSSCVSPESPLVADSANASPETPSKDDFDQSSNKGQDENEADNPHTPEGIFLCKQCNISFKNINALKRHNRSHSQSSSSYSCSMCPYTSLDKSTLIRHLRTHNGERPFQCAICKYAFTTKANCERHVRKRHKKLTKQEIRNAMQYNPNMADSPASEILPPDLNSSETVCKYCTVDFKFNRVLRHHLRSLHNSCSRKPFCCTLCKLGFSTKNNCIRHVLKQHPEMRDRLRDVVCANAMSDCSDQDSLQLSDESPQKESKSDTEPLNLTLKSLDFNCNNLVIAEDVDKMDDIVTAANSLVSLSEVSPPQDEPLDLAIHALDLSLKATSMQTDLTDSRPSSIYNLNLLTIPLCPTPPSSTSDTTDLSSVASSAAPNFPIPAAQVTVTPVTDMPLSCTTKEDICKMTFKIVNERLSPRNQRSFSCMYCAAGFTLKSNMERHIKRKHPEFARPTRSRNFIPTLSSTIGKNSVPTLSNKTRDALRVVLNSKAVSQQPVVQVQNESKEPEDIKDDISKDIVPDVIVDESSVQKVEDVKNMENEARNTAESSEDEQDGPTDLASVSSVIDTANSQEFRQYLLDSNQQDSSKEEKKKEIDNDPEDSETSSSTTVTKKRSSYTDSPNSVACPFCARKFPWTSSLRRHILTHTGQKPFKCSRCPIWFTTKSNCERHLLRKHGQNSELLTRSVPERPFKCNICPSSTFSTQGNLRKHYYLKHWKKTRANRTKRFLELGLTEQSSSRENSNDDEGEDSETLEEGEEEGSTNDESQFARKSENSDQQSDKPYKCHLCEEEFCKRRECLNHLKTDHSSEYQLLITKGAFETRDDPDNDTEECNTKETESEQQRKVKCAFCDSRFWSAEDLRRHMRTHSGQRPFSCDLCHRKFSLKHSMVRHRRKHFESSKPKLQADSTDDEECPAAEVRTKKQSKKPCQNSLLYLMPQTDSNLPSGSSSWSKSSASQKGTKDGQKASEEDDTDLIQNLLGIHDSKIIDEMLDSADSAARLLGVKEV